MSNPRPSFFVFAFDALLIMGFLAGLLWLVDYTQRPRKPAEAPPDAGVSLAAVWRGGSVVTSLPPRGEVLVYDRHGRHRATLLDGTWPLRLMVYPPRGEPLLLEVDELGRSSFTRAEPEAR